MGQVVMWVVMSIVLVGLAAAVLGVMALFTRWLEWVSGI